MVKQNGNGELSWEELTGISNSAKAGGLCFRWSRPEDLGLFGLLPPEMRHLIFWIGCEWKSSELDKEDVSTLCALKNVCRTFYLDVSSLIQDGIIRNSDLRSFDPLGMGKNGYLSCPFPYLNVRSLTSNYNGEEWISSLQDYVSEMKGRTVYEVDLENLFLFTDAPCNKLKVVVKVHDKVICTGKLESVANSILFQGKSSALYQQATGSTPMTPPKLDPQWFDILFNDRLSSNRYKVRQHNQLVDYVSSHRKEIIDEAESNQRLLDMANEMSCNLLQLDTFLRLSSFSLDVEYSSNLVLEFHHKSYFLGSVSFQLNVLGWITSTVPFIGQSGAPVITLRYTTLDTSKVKKVDPDFLGARFMIILREFSKELR